VRVGDRGQRERRTCWTALDDDGLMAISGELLSEHMERMQKLNAKHECMRPGEEQKLRA
jgi:hypothetical protein